MPRTAVPPIADTPSPRPRIAWIGLGAIAGHHLDAFARAPELGEPVAGCDVGAEARRRFADRIATVGTVDELLARGDADAVVVSTPTPTHRDVCRAVIERGGPRLLLVEKPIATTSEDVGDLSAAAARAGIELRGLYHAAYAPEVEWALANLGDELRDVARVDAEFVDPHLDPAVFGDSWLDSGINALSVVRRFVHVERGVVDPVASGPSTFEGRFGGRCGGRSVGIRIRTSWDAAAPSKVTRFELRDGGLVILDHQAMEARSLPAPGAGAAAAWSSEEPLPRLTQHYVRTFRQVLGREWEGADLELHRLLLDSLRGGSAS